LSGSAATLLIESGTIAGGKLQSLAGGQIIAEGGNDVLSGVTIASGTLVVSTLGVATLTLDGGTISKGAVIETHRVGVVIGSGTVTNGGTLFASGTDSLVEIASGAVVNGGLALIGNGIVGIAGSSGESVKFLSTGGGGLALDGVGSAYKGKVSGFGGSSHSNHNQFIDFNAIGTRPSV